jgi:hypothetical protein
MPEAKDARRLISDPKNEPDFYRISALYPLPIQGAVPIQEVVETPDLTTRRELPSKHLADVASGLSGGDEVQPRPTKVPHIMLGGTEPLSLLGSTFQQCSPLATWTMTLAAPAPHSSKKLR